MVLPSCTQYYMQVDNEGVGGTTDEDGIEGEISNFHFFLGGGGEATQNSQLFEFEATTKILPVCI